MSDKKSLKAILTRGEAPAVQNGTDILERISCSSFQDVHTDVKRYLFPFESLESLAKPPSASKLKALASEYTRFLVQLLKLGINALSTVAVPSNVDDCLNAEIAKELFPALFLALKSLACLRSVSSGRVYEIERQRYTFIRRLLVWRRFAEALDHTWLLFTGLSKLLSPPSAEVASKECDRDSRTRKTDSNHKGSPSADSVRRWRPPAPGESVDDDFIALLVAAASTLLSCLTELVPQRESEIREAIALLPGVYPWIQ